MHYNINFEQERQTKKHLNKLFYEFQQLLQVQ